MQIKEICVGILFFPRKLILPGIVFLGTAYTLTADLIFEDGFENSLSQWEQISDMVEIADISREGDKSVQFNANPEGVRSELIIDSNKGKFAWGEEYWIGFSILITVQPTGYQIISQHHSTPGPGMDGKPNWDCNAAANSFTIKANEGTFSVRTSTNPDLTFVVPEKGSATGGTVSADVPFKLNRWYDFVLHFRYANDDTGFFEIWVDGVKIVNVHNSPTVYNFDLCGEVKTPIQYQKIGFYHGSGQQSGELLYDAFRIGNENSSYEEVAPRGEKFSALDDKINTGSGQAVQVNVLENDMGSGIFVKSVAPGVNGDTMTDGSTVTYTPDEGFSGNDQFTYIMSNGEGRTDTALVSVYSIPSPSELARDMQVAIDCVDGKFYLSAKAPDSWDGVGNRYYSINGSTSSDTWTSINKHNRVLSDGQTISVDLSDIRISRFKYFQMISWLE